MVDAVKILGSLLSSGALSSGSGSKVLGTILSSALSGGGNNSAGGMGDLLGSLLGGGAQQQPQAGGLGGLLGGLLGGGTQQQPQGGGGLGGLLGGLLGGGAQPQTNTSAGGMGDLLGSLLGGNAQQPANRQGQAGGIGDLLGGLLSAGQQANTRQMGGSNDPLGGLLGSIMGGQGGSMAAGGGLGSLLGGAVTKYLQTQNPNAPDVASQYIPPAAHQEANQQAMQLIRTMINAAKSDGRVDDQEKERVLTRLQGLDQNEINFIQNEINSPLDVAGFIRSVPPSMGKQIYLLSLMAIDLDTNTEAKYLDQLAKAFNISPEEANELHAQAGAPKIYA
ncbi:DUF533 domain-containing protein [Thiolinea disciformis]|uniref:DUF533 domain-containing protein n=1 Tax=Thiolinea disciformis TaxID=125614 RepID=UPI000362CD6F|nr:DUF533 domain-containing protein [Thiolinea disciformis]